MKKYLGLTLSLLILAGGFALAANTHWLHIRVASEGEDQFNLNLPLSLVDSLLPMIEDKDWDRGHFRSGRFHWRDHEWTVAELRELWDAVKEERGYDLATFSNRHSNVRLFLDDRYLRVESEDDSRDQISAKIPITVVDALLSGEGEKLNLMAAVEALKTLGNDELIRVDAERSSVQVWIDQNSH